MKALGLIGALGAAATLAACADYYPEPPPPVAVAAAPVYGAPAVAVAPAPSCFMTRDIRNHTIGDDHTLYINVADRSVYRVEMSGSCLVAATSSDPIIIRNPPGSNQVCTPLDLDIGITVGGLGPGGAVSHCIVSAITPLTPAEVAALPAKLRP